MASSWSCCYLVPSSWSCFYVVTSWSVTFSWICFYVVSFFWSCYYLVTSSWSFFYGVTSDWIWFCLATSPWSVTSSWSCEKKPGKFECCCCFAPTKIWWCGLSWLAFYREPHGKCGSHLPCFWESRFSKGSILRFQLDQSLVLSIRSKWWPSPKQGGLWNLLPSGYLT